MFSEIKLVSLEKSGFLYCRKKLTLDIQFKSIPDEINPSFNKRVFILFYRHL